MRKRNLSVFQISLSEAGNRCLLGVTGDKDSAVEGASYMIQQISGQAAGRVQVADGEEGCLTNVNVNNEIAFDIRRDNASKTVDNISFAGCSTTIRGRAIRAEKNIGDAVIVKIACGGNIATKNRRDIAVNDPETVCTVQIVQIKGCVKCGGRAEDHIDFARRHSAWRANDKVLNAIAVDISGGGRGVSGALAGGCP